MCRKEPQTRVLRDAIHETHPSPQVYDKEMLNDEVRGRVELEKRALERCRHRNIVDLLHVEDDSNTCTLVFENCVLGDLVRRVALHKHHPSESSVFPAIIRQVLLGVQHMHEQV